MRRPSTAADSDRVLLGDLASGQDGAVERFYARFGRPLYAYATTLVGDPGEAEEVVQDAFVAAWRGASRFEGRSSVRSWLFGIARRQARDRHRRLSLDTTEIDAAGEVAAPEPGPEAAVIAAATGAELRSALARIPDADREVLVLTFAHEMSGPEVAAVLDIPAGTVKSRLFNARRRLRLALEEGEAR